MLKSAIKSSIKYNDLESNIINKILTESSGGGGVQILQNGSEVLASALGLDFDKGLSVGSVQEEFVGAAIKSTDSQGGSSNQWGQVTFNSLLWEEGSGVYSEGSPNQLTAPVDGIYLVYLNITHRNQYGWVDTFEIRDQDNNVLSVVRPDGQGTGGWGNNNWEASENLSAIAYLSAGDVIKVWKLFKDAWTLPHDDSPIFALILILEL